MEFSSLFFLFLFLPMFLVLFFILRKEAHNSFILAASLFFYAWGEGRYIYLLLISIAANYLLGLLVDRCETRHVKKTLFILAILFNLAFLGYYKYTYFFLDNLGLSPHTGNIHLPLGVSFFTFQALSFIIDIYRKTVSMDKNPLNFSLYMVLFPKLVTGPITPYHDLQKQIFSPRQMTIDDFAEGIKRFIIGLGKKTLIANSLAVPVNKIFAIPAIDLTAAVSWLGILCYTLQIYYDFSGYTDMAIGIARMCGFKLPENFNYPYMARSIKDFWRRWHISLATWLRDYLFLPIAYMVSRKIKSPKPWGTKAENWAYFISAFITFFLCGLWHGSAWTFVAWGIYYALLLIIEHAGLAKKIKRLPKPIQILYCQLLVIIGWVFFRSGSLDYAFSFLKTMFGFGSGDGIRYYAAYYLNNEVYLFLTLGLIGCFHLFPKLALWYETKKKNLSQNPSPLSRLLFNTTFILVYNLYLTTVLLAAIMVMASGTYQPFIYFRF